MQSMKKIYYCFIFLVFTLSFSLNADAQDLSFGVEKEFQEIKIVKSQTFKVEEDGVWRAYYKTGELFSEVLFKKFFDFRRLQFSLEMHGCRISYHKNGEIYKVSEFKRGKLIRIAYLNVKNE